MLTWLSLGLGCGTAEDITPPPAEIEVHTALGVVTPSDDTWAWPGIAGLPDVDDDDMDGVMDADDDLVEGNNDSTPFRIVTHGRPVRVTVRGDTASVILDFGGPMLAGSRVEADLPVSDEILGVAWFLDWNTRAELTVTDLTLGDEVTVDLVAAPLLLSHHLQPHVERAIVMEISERVGGDWNNADMLDDYAAVLGDRLTRISASTYDFDVWVQDEFEFASLIAPDQEMDVVFDTLRDRGLRKFAQDALVVPDVARVVVGFGAASSQDYGGNIEISPPVVVAGTHYPYGRIYWGSVRGFAVNSDVQDFFAAQRVQAPFLLDTSWLCVGHIDEVQTIIPDPAAPKGFKLWISDTDAGWALLDAMDPGTPLPKYAGNTAYATIGDITESAALRDLNRQAQTDHLDPMLTTLMAELGLDESDVVRIPALFERVDGCAGGLGALMPGTTNLNVVDDEDGAPVLLIADPFLRADVRDPESDPLIVAVRAVLPDGVEAVFVDDFAVYHLGIGEVHCGTQTEREAPPADWWATARHLLETP